MRGHQWVPCSGEGRQRTSYCLAWIRARCRRRPRSVAQRLHWPLDVQVRHLGVFTLCDLRVFCSICLCCEYIKLPYRKV